MPKDTVALLLDLHGQGLSCKEISKIIGFTDVAILRRLKSLGLASNNKSPKKLIVVDGHAICSGCGFRKHESSFAVCFNGSKPYKRSFCNSCLSEQIQTGRSIEAYLTNRVSQIKHRAKIMNLDFDLDKEWAIETFASSGGKCFYSGDTMSVVQRKSLSNRNQLSFDRVNPNVGYLKTNTVMCTYRMNSIKQDLSLDDLSFWIPRMHERATTFLARQGLKKNNGSSSA